jgi:outer membrane protein OmpA-like peptidoglycan-associated protein
VTIQSALPDFKQEVAINLKHGFPYLVLKVVDKATGKIIPNATVNLDEGKYDPSEYENKDGILRMRLNAASNYSIYASATDYFENSVNFSATDKVPGEYPMTLELEKITSDKQFVIYYDLNKADIRADATSVLNKLGKLLLKYPEFAIKISSHTDSRASALYNQSLSQQRSTSVLNYLIEHDIDKSRVQIVNYGKTQLVNNCGDGVACPEEQHQANRRSVIELLMP